MPKTETRTLLIPVTGEIQRIVVQAHNDSLVWATGLLREHGGSSVEFTIHLDVKERRVGIVLYTQQPEGSENLRARVAVAHIMGGAQFTFRGPVLLAGLTRDSAHEIEQLIGTT